ncbi:MAG: UDP-2,4-diacetamido-2,4,6-trideoxy-beta-L-altropyranose hydrolase [Thermoanaerobaculaceae bacterium]
MKPAKLLVRADASAEIGTGHVMRCLALAQAWQFRGGAVVFVSSSCPEPLAARVAAEGMSITRISAAAGSGDDIAATMAVAHSTGARWAVVDGYRFGPEFVQTLGESGLRVLEADDCGPARPWSSDWVLNQNIYAEEAMYPERAGSTRLLLGPKYALLRREFWRLRGHRRVVRREASRVLVTLGGGDPRNVTGLVLESIAGLIGGGVEVVAAIGAANPNQGQLQTLATGLGPQARIAVDAQDMTDLYLWADVAITGGGSTCWETAFAGLPSIILVLAENQSGVAKGLAESGFAINAGRVELANRGDLPGTVERLLKDRPQREEMTASGQRLVDGHGSERVITAMQGHDFWLRPAQAADCEILWLWANDPVTRANSFSSDAIQWETHVSWFAARLGDPNSQIFIASSNLTDQPIGFIRFDRENEDATISIAVAPEFRGKGLARGMISLASRRYLAESSARRIHAYIRPENSASIKVFAESGYAEADRTRTRGEEALHFVLEEGRTE